MRVPTDVPRIRDYLSMLARVWPIIVIATLVSAGAALGALELRKPNYSASVVLLAAVAGDPSTFALYYGGLGAQVRLPTYVMLAKSTQVTQRTIDDLNLTTTVDDLAGRISAEWTPAGVDLRGRAASSVLKVSVTAHTPDAAIREVNSVAANLVSVSRELEYYEAKLGDENHKGPAAELTPIGTARSAELVPVPIFRTLAIGGGVGLGVSLVVMLAVEIFRDTVASRGQLDHIIKRAMQSKT